MDNQAHVQHKTEGQMAPQHTQAAGSSQPDESQQLVEAVWIYEFDQLSGSAQDHTPGPWRATTDTPDWDGTPRLAAFVASGLNLVPSQPLQPGAVGGPVGGTVSGNGTVVVKVYALGSGVAIPGQGSDLSLAQGAFELEAHGHRLVIDPLAASVTHRLVTPVEGDISAVWHAVETVDQEDLAKFGNGISHGFCTSIETVILSLPQGAGKTLFAKAIAARLGCTHVVDEWVPWAPLFAGALHLTHCEVA